MLPARPAREFQAAPMIISHDGQEFGFYAAYPASGEGATVVVLQEIFGVNAVMRGVCDDLAASGFIAICPDLFWRQQPGVQLTDQSQAEWEQAFKLMQGMDIDLAVQDIQSTLRYARGMRGASGKTGTIGYCLGGKLAYLAAARTDADANVGYYGVGLEEYLGEVDNIRTPLLLHIAEADKFSNAAARMQILAATAANPNITTEVHPGVDHAFARPGGEHYNRNAADHANTLTAQFLAKQLS